MSAVIHSYDKGDRVRCSGVFTDINDAATDPTAVFMTYVNPAGTSVTLTYGTDAALVKDSTGHYHVDVDGDSEGTWYWRMYSTGTGKAAAEGQFLVKESVF